MPNKGKGKARASGSQYQTRSSPRKRLRQDERGSGESEVEFPSQVGTALQEEAPATGNKGDDNVDAAGVLVYDIGGEAERSRQSSEQNDGAIVTREAEGGQGVDIRATFRNVGRWSCEREDGINGATIIREGGQEDVAVSVPGTRQQEDQADPLSPLTESIDRRWRAQSSSETTSSAIEDLEQRGTDNAWMIDELRRLQAELEKERSERKETSRQVSEHWSLILSMQQMVTARHSGIAGVTPGTGPSQHPADAVGGPVRPLGVVRSKPNVKLTGLFTKALRERMGMEPKQPLPDWQLPERLPLVRGHPQLRINWDLPWNSPENRDMVTDILHGLTMDANSTYSREVSLAGFDQVVNLCLGSVHNLYHRRRQEKRKGEQAREEEERRRRRSQRKTNKRKKRAEELGRPENADLADRYGAMKWNVNEAISGDETDEESGNRQTEEASGPMLQTAKLVLPWWRSRQNEEIVRELDERRRRRVNAPFARQLHHPQQAVLPPIGTLVPPVYRFQVSRLVHERDPSSTRNVRPNLLTLATPDPDRWGEAPPYPVVEPNSGAYAESSASQGRRLQVDGEHVNRPALASVPGIVGGEGESMLSDVEEDSEYVDPDELQSSGQRLDENGED